MLKQQHQKIIYCAATVEHLCLLTNIGCYCWPFSRSRECFTDERSRAEPRRQNNSFLSAPNSQVKTVFEEIQVPNTSVMYRSASMYIQSCLSIKDRLLSELRNEPMTIRCEMIMPITHGHSAMRYCDHAFALLLGDRSRREKLNGCLMAVENIRADQSHCFVIVSQQSLCQSTNHFKSSGRI